MSYVFKLSKVAKELSRGTRSGLRGTNKQTKNKEELRPVYRVKRDERKSIWKVVELTWRLAGP